MNLKVSGPAQSGDRGMQNLFCMRLCTEQRHRTTPEMVRDTGNPVPGPSSLKEKAQPELQSATLEKAGGLPYLRANAVPLLREVEECWIKESKPHHCGPAQTGNEFKVNSPLTQGLVSSRSQLETKPLESGVALLQYLRVSHHTGVLPRQMRQVVLTGHNAHSWELVRFKVDHWAP